MFLPPFRRSLKGPRSRRALLGVLAAATAVLAVPRPRLELIFWLPNCPIPCIQRVSMSNAQQPKKRKPPHSTPHAGSEGTKAIPATIPSQFGDRILFDHQIPAWGKR